ncbi:MAG: sigma-70 family RNA polymerase sigma factor [Chloroflexota bacterium]|nr:sigma-70 family RNA polymerase sigma factor [Chloroflexota bacterium]
MNDHHGPGAGPSLLRPPLALVPRASGHAAAPADDAEVTRLALAARAGDRRARHDLYRAPTPSLDRMVAGCVRLTRAVDCPRRDGQPWDREDLAQEAYLVFCDLLRVWSGEGPFSPYLFGYFPWRLRNAWRRLRPDRPRGLALPRLRLDLVIDESALAEEARVLLEALAGDLPEVERIILLAHVQDGVTLTEIGRRLGLRPQQVGRRWLAIKRWLRGEIGLACRGGRIVPFPIRPWQEEALDRPPP